MTPREARRKAICGNEGCPAIKIHASTHSFFVFKFYPVAAAFVDMNPVHIAFAVGFLKIGKFHRPLGGDFVAVEAVVMAPTCIVNGRFRRPSGEVSFGCPAIMAAAAKRSAMRGES